MGPQYESGKYWGRITGQWMSEASTGTVQFCLKFLILGKVDLSNPGGDLISCPQGERTVYRAITDNTIEYVKSDLQQLGYDRESFKYLDPNTPDFCDFRDKELAFFCTHEVGQDNKGLREKWGIARQDGGANAKPLDPKKLRDLDNLFGKHLKGIKPAGNSPPNGNPSMPTNQELQEANAAPDLPF